MNQLKLLIIKFDNAEEHSGVLFGDLIHTYQRVGVVGGGGGVNGNDANHSTLLQYLSSLLQ